jgi:LPS export ABC transporter protein LptC
MGKKLVIAGFVASLALALYVYLTREHKRLRDALDKRSAKEPRVVMEDFTIYRYRGPVLTGKLTARLGHFYEPNVVELDGEIRGERLTKNGVEMIGAESATGYFNATSLTKMMGDTQLDRAELTGFVEVGVKGHLLTTDYAEYINKKQLVRSPRPVQVEGPGRRFSGEDGFTYSLADETLTMTGPVSGVVLLDEK